MSFLNRCMFDFCSFNEKERIKVVRDNYTQEARRKTSDYENDVLRRNTTDGRAFAHLSGDASNLLWMRFRVGDEMLSLADLNNEKNYDILWRDETGFTFASLSGNPYTIQVIGDRSGVELRSYDSDNFSIIG